jgi:PAS domain S-box-containing protein
MYITDSDRKMLKKVIESSTDDSNKLLDLLENKLENLFKRKLRQVIANYEVIMENANDFIAIINQNLEFEEINEDIHKKKLGYGHKELIGNSVLDYIHPEDLRIIKEAFKSGFEEGKATASFRFKNKKGNYLWIESKGKLFTDRNEKQKAIIISRDISKKKELDKKLKKSEKEYKILINNLFDVAMKIDITGKIHYVSPQIESDYGYSVEEVIGTKIFDYMHQNDIKRVSNKFKELLKGQRTLSSEYRVKRKDGTYLWVLSRGRVINEGEQDFVIGFMRNIDKSKRVNEKFKESESKYRELFEGARDGFVMVDTDAHIKDANQAYCKMIGYSLEELRNLKSFYQITPKKWHDWEKKEIWEKKLLKHGHSGIYEKEYIRKDGTIVPIEVQAYTVFDEDKNVKYLWGVIRDITERKAAKQKIIKSEKKYRLLAENARDIIWVMDLNFNFTYMSPSVEEVRGYTVEEVMNQSLEELFTPESLKIAQQTIKKKLNPKKLKEPHYDARTTLELEHTCKDGSTVWVEVKMSLLRDNDGNPTGIIGVSRDITKRRDVEKRLEKSEEELRQKYEEQEILLDNINTQIWYLTDERTYGAVNKAHADFNGCKKKDLAFKDLYDIFPKDVAEICEKGNIEVFSTKRQIRSEEWLPHKSGERRLISITKTPKLDEKGNVEYVVCAAEDITEHKEYEEKLIRLNNLKSEILRRTSHELKTPLVSIKGFSSLLLKEFGNDLNGDAKIMVEEIQDGCKRLENLIKDILDSAKLESGKSKIKKKEYNLRNLVNTALKSLKGIIRSRKQDISLELNESLIIHVDKERFLEVLENVISNALKYTPPEGKILIKSKENKDKIIISIKDTGIGFTPEEKSQLFKQFGKIERYGEGYDLSIDGSGLGLYIAKKTAELHGGDIWMESAGRNKGSTFYISLPKS